MGTAYQKGRKKGYGYGYSVTELLNEWSSALSQRREMTYILGSKCTDGAVLVGDRKVTEEGGTDFFWEDKIFMDIHPIIVGSSGVLGLFEKFRRRIANYVSTQRSGNVDTFISEIERVTRELNLNYRDVLGGQVFDVLVGIKTQDAGGLLQYILPRGFAEPVRRYKAIGHGEPYGSFFLKQLWRPNMTMEQVAELGYFIIKYIEGTELDSSVGIGNSHPQVWFIPNNPPPNISEDEKKKYEVHKADDQLLQKLKELAESRLQKVREDTVEIFTTGQAPNA